MGLFSACFRNVEARETRRPRMRFISKLFRRGRRNRRGQDQLDEAALIGIRQDSEIFLQERGNDDQERVEEAIVREIVLESTIEPLNDQEEKEVIETPNPQYSERDFSVTDSEPVRAQNPTSTSTFKKPKMQFLIFCFFFLLCFYSNWQEEVQIQNLVQNMDNASTTFFDSPSEMDQVMADFQWVIYVKYFMSFMFAGFGVACYLCRESIGGGIMLLWYILTMIETRNESIWLRWLRWINTRRERPYG